MTVYVDTMKTPYKQPRYPFRKLVLSHMIADTEQELYAMAEKIDLNWNHVHRGSTLHFDVSQSKKKLAIQHGAVELNRRDFIKKVRELRTRSE